MRESTLVDMLDTRLRGYDILSGKNEFCQDSSLNDSARILGVHGRFPKRPFSR